MKKKLKNITILFTFLLLIIILKLYVSLLDWFRHISFKPAFEVL